MRTIALAAAFLAGSLAASAQEVAHFDTIEKAVAAAKKDKKDILVDFTGSDWCGWCIKLNKEVFSQEAWKKVAAQKFVFVELDFPRRKELPAEQRQYNDRMQELYGVEGFPTIVVLDSEGQPYARTGYQPGGPEAYLKHLDEFAGRKGEISKLLKQSGTGTPEERIKSIDELLTKLDEWEIAFGYGTLKEQIVDLDAKNAAGKRLKYAKELARMFAHTNKPEPYAKYLKIVKELDPAAAEGIETQVWINKEVIPLLQKREWQAAMDKLSPKLEAKGEAGQNIHYFAAVCQIRLGQKDKCIEHLEKSVSLAPDSELAQEIKEQLEQLREQ